MRSGLLERSRFLYRAWRYRLKVEAAEIAFVRHCLSRGDTCVDLGGHKGAFTFWMQHAVGRTGRVYTFEPQHELAAYLRRVTAKYPHVEIVHAAVSDRSGVVQLRRESATPSPGATLEAVPSADLWSQPVQAETLTAFFSCRPGRPIRLIKCDVEGHELAVFRGASSILREDQPILLFECEQRHCRNHPMRNVFEYLQSLGYYGEFFQGGRLHPLDGFELHGNEPGGPGYVNNFVFRSQQDEPASASQPRGVQRKAG